MLAGIPTVFFVGLIKFQVRESREVDDAPFCLAHNALTI